MKQTAIPYYFFRGGSSRGPFFNLVDLPADRQLLSDVLLSVLGSGHALNIDGIGGGNAVTTKVAILSASNDDWADVDYLFAQVGVENREVDFKPTCGNMMIAVGPASIEMGLFEPSSDLTDVKILSVNTGARVVSTICTPDNEVNYDGTMQIDGVPGTAAPIAMDFSEVAGSVTGALLPTGNTTDLIQGVNVTCIDFAMPMVIGNAEDFGITGCENRLELDANKALFEKIEQIRLAAAAKMGMGDCRKSVTPKFGLISKANNKGTMNVRYFMPWATHPTVAVTGAQCLAACALTKGSVANGIAQSLTASPCTMILEHPLGTMEVNVTFDGVENPVPVSAGVVRTARKLAQGHVFVPKSVWEGHG